MKLKWPKKIKYGVLIAGLLMTTGSIGMAIYEGRAPHKKASEAVVCTYKRDEALNYKVNVNSNKLYDQTTVPEGQYYVSNYVDSIVFQYTNTYTASVKAEVTGAYKVTTEFRGYAKEQGSEGEKKVTIWSKSEVLKPNQSFSQIADSYQINEKLVVDLKKYSDFMKQLQKEENLFMPTEVILKIEGTQKARLPKEEVTIPISVMAVIPITEDYFKVEQQVGEGVNEKQVEQVVTLLPVNYKKVIAGGIIGLLGLAGCIAIGLLVEDIDEKEKRIKKIKSIYMEYGSRMIHLDHVNKEGFKNSYQLSSLEDFIKLADELDKPILVETRENLETVLYVTEHQDLYSYALEAIDTQDIEKLQTEPQTHKNNMKTRHQLKDKVMTQVLEDEEDNV